MAYTDVCNGGSWSWCSLSCPCRYCVPAHFVDSDIDLLAAMPRMLDCTVVFPSPQNKVMSDMTISAVMRRIQESEEKAGRPGFLDSRSRRRAVPHGLRSSFRDWIAERTDYPRDMAEISLAHTVGNEVERAYRRSDMLDRRREMMGEWASFVLGRATGG